MQATDQELINGISSQLGQALPPSSVSQQASWDIYEIYLWSVVLRAVQQEGGTWVLENRNGQRGPISLDFRTSPGYINQRPSSYVHAVISFPGRPDLEAHQGVYVSGTTGQRHECDVVVVDRDEALLCRAAQAASLPRVSKCLLSIECKFYTGKLKISLAREYVGLVTDLGSKNSSYFATNSDECSATTFLSRRSQTKLKWVQELVPRNASKVNAIQGRLQGVFANYKLAR